MKSMRLFTNPKQMDWLNGGSCFFFNPRDPSAEKIKAQALKLPFFKHCVYIFSSSGSRVWILSKEAFLHSAQAVNQHLKTTACDRWLISLPLFHVGGLAITARSFCGGFLSVKSALKKWSPKAFCQELKEQNISLCSLVPAQVYDLAQQNLKAPKSLRAVVIGGGALSLPLYKKAKALGWPALPSYGMTETCSQIACAPLQSLCQTQALPQMQILKHIQIKKSQGQGEGDFKIKSLSLPTACFDLKTQRLYDPKDSKGFMPLPDKILLENNSIQVLGRKDDEIKILGESVNLQKLTQLLENMAQGLVGEYRIMPLRSARRGFSLALVTDSFLLPQALGLIKKFNQKTLPFENIESLYFVSEIKKTALRKFHRAEMEKRLGLNYTDHT